MLELAIAEAYRPRPSQHPRSRPPQPASHLERTPQTEAGSRKPSNALSRAPSFATNPNASARVSAFWLHSRSLRSSRPGSAVSTSSTATERSAHPFRLPRFARRWTATPSTLAETEIEEGLIDMNNSVERIDSVVASLDHECSIQTPSSEETSSAAKSLETKIGVGNEPKVQGKTQKDSITKPMYHTPDSTYNDGLELPSLPSRVPLPPQEELEPFDTALQSAIEDLLFFARSTSLNPTPKPVLTALSNLSHLSDLSACIAVSWPEYWALITHAVNLLVSILPPQHLGLKNALLRCLILIAQSWQEEQDKGGRGMIEIADLAGEVIDKQLEEKKATKERLGTAFAAWITDSSVHTADDCYKDAPKTTVEKGETLHILALTLSPTVKEVVMQTLANTQRSIRLSLLTTTTPTSPANLHTATPLPSILQTGLSITTHSFTALASLAKEVDILLLFAQTIDSSGNAVCDKGALSAAVCVKTLGKGRVVVLCSVDDIVATRVDGGEENVEEGGGETVSKRFVDVHVTEKGVVRKQEIEKLAKRAGELERHVFGGRD